MKLSNASFKSFFATVLFCLCAVLWAGQAHAQAVIRGGRGVVDMPMPGGMPTPPTANPNPGATPVSGGPWIPSEPLSSGTNSTTNGDEITLSFQSADINTVVQWLAQTTGKTVLKASQVQCQLNITSSGKVSKREAINNVYRALALEGFTTIETSKTILIVPEGKEPKIGPEVVTGPTKDIPEGRQRLTKVFPLKHIRAAELKDKIGTALTDKANITLDENLNQIVITDYTDNIRVVGELIEALDSERPPDVAVRVIQLKHVSAQDLAKELAPLYQKMSSQPVKDVIDVAADDRSNALIVFSSEANYNALEKVITLLDREDAEEKVTETFTLKNADAQDVAKQLQDLGQNSSGSSSRIVYYLNGPGDSGNPKKMSVVADRRRNAIIVQAPPAQMEELRKMIHELDAPVSDDSLAPRIYHLKYASASDIEDVLNELFLKKQQQRSYFDPYSDYYESSSVDRDVGRLYGKVRITAEPYSNTIIVTANSKENLAAVEEVLNQLDAPSEAGESTLRISLKYGKAVTVAKNLNILFAKNGSPPLRPDNQQNQPNGANQGQQQQQQTTPSTQSGFDLTQEAKEEGYYPWLGGQGDNVRGGDTRTATPPVSDLVGRVRVVADPRINALLVSANVHFFPQVLKLIGDMDAVSDQVLIEARIVEVSSDFLDQLGVRYAPNGSQTFTADDMDNSILANVTAEYMKGFGGSTSVNTPSPSTSTMTQALTSLRSGVLDSTINMDFLIQFLHRTTEATVLGDPQITINDNETGKLFVGQEVPKPNNTQVNALSGSQNTAVDYKMAGVILEVTPHINSSGDVQLQVHVESSALVPGQLVLNAPVFNTRQFRTDLTAKNGQTLVLGGIIQKQITDTVRKTPILGDIPGLGWLFKKTDKSINDVELMVFLRPKVIHTPEDAQDALDKINQQAPKMKKWQDDSLPVTKPK